MSERASESFCGRTALFLRFHECTINVSNNHDKRLVVGEAEHHDCKPERTNR